MPSCPYFGLFITFLVLQLLHFDVAGSEGSFAGSVRMKHDDWAEWGVGNLVLNEVDVP